MTNSIQNSQPLLPAGSEPRYLPPAQSRPENLPVPASPTALSTDVFDGRSVTGNAQPRFALLSSEPIRLIGLNKGDRLKMDAGIIEADSQIEKLTDDEMILRSKLDLSTWGVSWVVQQGLKIMEVKPFVEQNDQADITFRVIRDGEHYHYELTDNYNQGNPIKEGTLTVRSNTQNVQIKGQTVQQQQIHFATDEANLIMTILNDPQQGVRGSISIPLLPPPINSIDFEKQ